jgi:hypothetical protein
MPESDPMEETIMQRLFAGGAGAGDGASPDAAAAPALDGAATPEGADAEKKFTATPEEDKQIGDAIDKIKRLTDELSDGEGNKEPEGDAIVSTDDAGKSAKFFAKQYELTESQAEDFAKNVNASPVFNGKTLKEIKQMLDQNYRWAMTLMGGKIVR